MNLLLRLLIVIVIGMLRPAAGWAQLPSTPPGEAMVETDPLRCWWRTDAGAVMIGETFSVVLTCAVLETDAVQVVPDESRLAVAAVQLAPFEIVGGSRPADLRSGQRRFFQYQYTLRIINADVIGKDVNLPDLTIHYRVRSSLEADAELQGRDRLYVMPAQPIRVLSLVPPAAPDIRDASGESFARVESLGLRAGAFNIASIALLALGSVMLVLALARVVGGVRRKGRAEEESIADRTILRHVAGELGAVQRETEQTGWNDELSSRALAALRLVGACALDRQVSQNGVVGSAEPREGRVPVRRGLRGKRVSVSSAVTSEDVARALARLPETALPERRQLLEDLRTALGRFTSTQYGRTSEIDRRSLDEALTSGIRTAKQLERASWKKYFRLPFPRAREGERRA